MWAQNTKYIVLPCQQLTSAGISCYLAKPNFDLTDKTKVFSQDLETKNEPKKQIISTFFWGGVFTNLLHHITEGGGFEKYYVKY